MASSDNDNIKRLTVVCLRQELSKRGLSSAGLKHVLVQRLEEALEKEVGSEVEEHEEIETKKEETTDLTEADEEMEDERGQKRKRMNALDANSPHILSEEINSLQSELKASDIEKERLQFKLEEALARIEQAKQDGKNEAEQELTKDRLDMRSQLDVAVRKREELEFKLSQKEDELQERAASKNTEMKENQQIKSLKDQLKKKESLEFQCEQMKEQVADYKQQVRILQQKIDSMQLNNDRDKKEKERTLLEERGKTEAIRIRMETQREDLVKEWRKEFEKKMEEQQETLRQQTQNTKKIQKEFAEKQSALEEEIAERTKEELQRLTDMQADLQEKESQLRENDELQGEIEVALEQRSRSIEEDAARLESDKQEFELKRQSLEKERQELEERLWAIDLDAKRRRDKEKVLDDKVMELLGKNEALVSTIANMKDANSKKVQELSQENERLNNLLALSQARLVAGRQITPAPSIQPPKDKLVEADQTQELAVTSRQTRSQARSQEQQSRETILTKTRSRASYIPKPSTTRKLADSTASQPPKPSSGNNKENSHNGNGPEVMPTATEPSEPPAPARKQRTSMIPIRRGSSLLQVSRS